MDYKELFDIYKDNKEHRIKHSTFLIGVIIALSGGLSYVSGIIRIIKINHNTTFWVLIFCIISLTLSIIIGVLAIIKINYFGVRYENSLKLKYDSKDFFPNSFNNKQFLELPKGDVFFELLMGIFILIAIVLYVIYLLIDLS